MKRASLWPHVHAIHLGMDATGMTHGACKCAPPLCFLPPYSQPALISWALSLAMPPLFLALACSCPQHTSCSTCTGCHETSTRGACFVAPHTCATARAQVTGACSCALSSRALSPMPGMPHPFMRMRPLTCIHSSLRPACMRGHKTSIWCACSV